jgi:hypothetical protein
MQEQKIILTKPQRAFLEEYFEDILTGGFEFEGMEKAEFIKRVSSMDFDDGMASDAARIRVGRNLNRLGLFDEFDVHGIVQADGIYLSFNSKGAEVMWGLMAKAAEEGRLPLPHRTAMNP